MKKTTSLTSLFSICLILLVFIFAIPACKKVERNVLKIESTNFKEEIRQTQNLEFTFNQSFKTSSFGTDWIDTPLVAFTPVVAGRFKWKNSNTLVFSPDVVFPPYTNFKATPSDMLLSYITDNNIKMSKDATIDFHTPYLAIDLVSTYWKSSSDNSGEILIGANVNLNYEVQAKKLAENLSVQVNGKDADYVMKNVGASSKIKLDILQDDINTKQKKITFTINENMLIAKSDQPIGKAVTAVQTLNQPAEMDISSVEAEHDGLNGYIKINTTQQIVSKNLKSFITVKPAVSYEIQERTNGITIKSSAFKADNKYDLTIKKGLKGVFEGSMDEDYTTNIVFGEIEPTIKFTNRDALYLSNAGYKNVGVQIINVDKVVVSISKIFANNIMAFLRDGMRWGYHNEYDYVNDDYEYYDYRYYDINRFGTKVFTDTVAVKDLEKLGKISLLNIDFKDKLPQLEGMYVVEVKDAEHRYISQSKLMVYSDIGLIVKNDDEQIHVFANSINDATAIAGVKVNLVSSTNQVYASQTTNENGVAVFSNIKNRYPNFKVAMITASTATDYTYMMLNQTRVNSSRFEVGGKQPNPANLEAFIYGDRDLYRPGETVNLSTIVRTSEWEIIKDMPIVLKVLLPNGKEYKSIRKTLNDEGVAYASVTIPNSLATGTYRVEVYTANDVLLNSKAISIEEFIPDRIKVTVATNKETVRLDEEIEISGTAMNLFGPPAANRNYELEMNLKRKAFRVKDYPDYLFSIKNKVKLEEQIREAKTADDGTFNETFTIDEKYKDIGILQGQFFVTVFDETGRPVNRVAEFDVQTQETFYGIKSFDRYVGTKQNLEIPLIAVNAEGKAVNADAEITIIRYQYRTVLESTRNGRYRYRSQEEELVEVKKNIKLSKNGKIHNFRPNESGRYVVRIKHPSSNYYVERRFYAYRYGDTQNTSFEINQEGKIDIVMDKEAYEIGETAKILLNTPFDGRMLVTVESDKLIRYLYVDTKNKSKQISLNITEEFLPNVFVSATLIRPAKELNIPLTVAHGYAPLIAESKQNKLTVAITAVEKSASRKTQNITVKTIPNAEVTIAVVDEGILQIKNYQTPNPYDYFYQKRALAVKSHDLYPYLFPEMMPGNMLAGGGMFDLGKRVNPVTNKRVKLVSFWSGPLRADGSGRVDYSVEIPQFSGDLRVMAVVTKGKAFGAADHNIKVADPVVISAGLPRFLSPTDSIDVPVTLSNTTQKDMKAQVNLSLNGPLNAIGQSQQTVNLKANSENKVNFKLAAATNIGAGKVSLNVKADGKSYLHETDMSVRPAASLQKKSISGSVKGGSTETIAIEQNFIPESMDGKLVVSRSPIVEFSNNLQYLIGYPHGCIEQTISKAFPQMYYLELAKSIDERRSTAEGETSRNPAYNVQEAVKKIEGMQMYSGGLSYWRGSDRAHWWGSVYAAHFLTEAQKAGYEVNDKVVNSLFTYLRKQLGKKETYEYVYYVDGTRKTREVARRELIYTLYVMALNNQAPIPMMNYYKSKPELLTLDSRYMLAAAYAFAGDKGKFMETLPKVFEGENSERELDGSFASPVRDKAIALNALLEADPNHPQIGELSRMLIAEMKDKGRYWNTQERSFSFLALGKLAKLNNQSNITADVLANGKSIGKYTKGNLVLDYAKDINTSQIELNTTGTGNLYYYWYVEGLTQDGSYEEEDSKLKVRKTYFDRDGKALTNLKVAQNDLIVVEISLISTGKSKVPNVVVTDMLPAGFEIENPRLGVTKDIGWAKKSGSIDHQDFRDDRVHFFTTATKATKYFYYTVRAVSPGNFVLGPVAADAMYDGEYHSVNGGQTLVVAAK